MTKDEIIDYVLNSPENTNPNVLKGMLNQLDGGGSSDYSIAKVTLVSNLDNAYVYGSFQEEDTTFGKMQATGEYDLILYKGKAEIASQNRFDSTASGAITISVDGTEAIITGDCSFSLINNK